MSEDQKTWINACMAEYQRLHRAIIYSRDGFKSALKEPAFRAELALAAVLIPVALVIGGLPARKALLIGSVMLVLIVELLNTAIERAMDRVSTEQHPLTKAAKDMGSAAVLLALLNVGIVWGLLLL